MPISTNYWRAAECEMPLHEAPMPVHMGRSVHGVKNAVDRFLLPKLWSLHLYRYQATLVMGKHTLPIRPGFAGITPPNQAVAYHYEGPSSHLYAHFVCVETAAGAPLVSLPLMQDLGERFTSIYAQMEEVVRIPNVPLYRKQARLWDILCQITVRPFDSNFVSPLPDENVHAAVRYALEQIEHGLGATLTVEKLAREAGVSYGYLSHLFKIHLGTTVIGHIRQRRIERATHLLTHSTLPIKSIAVAVGIPDLHLFNKTMREACGGSPRAIRAKGPDAAQTDAPEEKPVGYTELLS